MECKKQGVACKRHLPDSCDMENRMEIGKIVAALACAGVLAACAAQPGIKSLTDEQRGKVRAMEIIYGGATMPGTVVGRLQGAGCQKELYDSRIDAEIEAVERIKINAALIDADAVVNAVCREAAVDWSATCWVLIECSGEAFRYGKR